MDGLRLLAVVGPSARLRDEGLHRLRATWSGPVQAVTEPDDLDTLLYGLDAPPLFGEPPMTIIRAGEAWIRSRQDALAPHVERPRVAGVLVLVVPSLDQRWSLAKALTKAKALVDAGPPMPRACCRGCRPGSRPIPRGSRILGPWPTCWWNG